MGKKSHSAISLEEALVRTLALLDSQVARELQRTPLERERFGVQKREPYRKRIEAITALIIERFGERSIGLDGVLILSQALGSALRILGEELGESGLGAVRTQNILEATENSKRDLRLLEAALGGDGEAEH